MSVQGIANLVGPVFAGWLYDFSKEWFLTFGLTGFFIGNKSQTIYESKYWQLFSRLYCIGGHLAASTGNFCGGLHWHLAAYL